MERKAMIHIRTVKRGDRVAVWTPNGDVRFVNGPQRILVFRDRVEPLRRYSAESHQYLAVRMSNGRTENRRGPIDLWFNPVEHESITVESAVPIDAHEALVVYQRQTNDLVTRRVLTGPAQYVPQENEWLHEFSWHGADPVNPNRKVPRALQFTKLRTIPDQMYFDVREVRTADDALLVVRLMVFFELIDIHRMLDQTHDPIADFINALAADVIEFAAGVSFEAFKERTSRLSELEQYSNLTGRAERVGYRINKVVYRGYIASEKLQAMHDAAIETRTELKLKAETERQAQELADLKLLRESERDVRRREMQHAQGEHEQQMHELQHVGELHRKEADHKQQVAHRRELQLLDAEHLHTENEERLRFLREIQSLQVDVTRYLVAQYQHPDRLIQIDGTGRSQLHLHEQLGV
jgi:hypothetical protein